jgi:sn-glycerol 3-phosphate transport system permease protein
MAPALRFLKDVLWPLSRTNVIALFVIMFIYGWNQYLWPLIIATDTSMYPIGIGIKTLISGGDSAVEWNLVMATMILAMLPPGLVVVVMQKWFVKGLVDSEK